MGPTRRSPAAIARLALLLLVGTALLTSTAHAEPTIKAVGSIGMTVADVDRSVVFYSGVLGFEKVSDVEVWGGDYERLQGVFGLRMRVVRMQLGDESIELTEYLTPRGRPFPADSRGNDRWFQHIAIIVSDMDRAYARLRQHRVQHASPAPQQLPDWNPNAAGIRRSTSEIPTVTSSRFCGSRPTKAIHGGTGPPTGSSSGSTIPRSWWPTPSGAWPATGMPSASASWGSARTTAPSRSA